MSKTSNKQRLREIVDRLPDDVSFARVVEELRAWQKVETGLRELDACRGIPHEEIEREFLDDDT